MACHGQPFSIPFLISLLSQLVLVTATCYGADQNHTAQNQIYTPCNQNTPFSMCFRSQVDAGGHLSDLRCLPNGLIETIDWIWREGCTDPSWKSEYCLEAFNACENDANGNSPVTPCSGYSNSTTWCCGSSNQACCGRAGAITIAATLGPSTTTASSSSTVSSTGFSSSSTSGSSSPTSTSSSMALSVGAQAGIGVGVSLAGIAILGGIIWFVLRMRTRRRANIDRSRHNASREKHGMDGNTIGGWESNAGAGVKEPQLRHELDGGHSRPELPAS